jgi:hypothetical protein
LVPLLAGLLWVKHAFPTGPLVPTAFAAVIAATLVFLLMTLRHTGRAARIAVGTGVFFCGVTVFLMMSLHLAFILEMVVRGDPVRFPPVRAILIGVVIMIPGLGCLGCARGLTLGMRSSWRVAIWSNGFLLVASGVVLPLQPGFSSMVIVLALGSLAGLTAVRKALDPALEGV